MNNVDYNVETKYFALDENFLYYLRSKYCYKKILLSEIDEIVIKKRSCFKNWGVIILVGILFLSISAYIIISGFDSLINVLPGYHGGKMSWIAVLTVIMTLLFGVVLIVQPLQRNYTMKIFINGSKELLCLKEVVKKGEMKVLLNLLKDNVKQLKLLIENDLY